MIGTKKNIISFVCATNDINSIINVNFDLIIDLSKKFEKIYILNLFNLKLFNKKLKINKKINYKLPKNIKIIFFKNNENFINFCGSKKLICFQNLGKSFEYFSIFRLLKRVDSINIIILNLGNFGNKTFIDFNIKFFFKSFYHYYDRCLYYLFRFLTIFGYFPRIDILFHSDKEIINNLKNGISDKIDKFFGIKKVSYFRKIIKINSKSFDFVSQNKIKNNSRKFIAYIDTPLDHLDRTIREGKVSNNEKKKFYGNLKNFLSTLSKQTKKEILICPHPKMKSPEKIFSNFKISKKRTIEIIPKASLIIFSLSSAMTTAVLLRKKILCIQSNLMGDYLLRLSNKYINDLDLKKVNIDNFNSENKNKTYLKNLYNPTLYDRFIKNRLNCDGKIKSSDRIINIILKNYF